MALSPKGTHLPLTYSTLGLSSRLCWLKLLDYRPSSRFHVLAYFLLAPLLYLLLERRYQFLETSILNKSLFNQMLLECLCSLFGVEGPGLSFLYFNLHLFRNYLKSSFLVSFLFPLYENFLYNVFYHFVKGRRARV